jgi:hypothetical protein
MSLGTGGSGRDSKDLEIRGLVGAVAQLASVGDGGAVEQDGMGGCGRGSVRSGIPVPEDSIVAKFMLSTRNGQHLPVLWGSCQTGLCYFV